MGRASFLLFFIQVAVAAIALISCLSAEEDEIKTLPRWGWIAIILLFPLVGGIVWFVAGRKRTGQRAGGPGGGPRPAWPTGGAFPERRRPLAPDDDPDFLRSIKPRPVDPDEDKPKDGRTG